MSTTNDMRDRLVTIMSGITGINQAQASVHFNITNFPCAQVSFGRMNNQRFTTGTDKRDYQFFIRVLWQAQEDDAKRLLQDTAINNMIDTVVATLTDGTNLEDLNEGFQGVRIGSPVPVNFTDPQQLTGFVIDVTVSKIHLVGQ